MKRATLNWAGMLFLGVLLAPLFPARAGANPAPLAGGAAAERVGLPNDPLDLGSSDRPILVTGIDVNALELTSARDRDSFGIQLGPLGTTVFGITGLIRSTDNTIDHATDTAPAETSNQYSGAEASVTLGAPAEFYLEAGEVTTRDGAENPPSSLESGEYWAAATGFGIHF